jgi:hypothetical protein
MTPLRTSDIVQHGFKRITRDENNLILHPPWVTIATRELKLFGIGVPAYVDFRTRDRKVTITGASLNTPKIGLEFLRRHLFHLESQGSIYSEHCSKDDW